MRDGTPHPAVLAPGPVREYHMYNPSSIFSIKYSIYPYIQRGRSGGGRVFFTKDSLRKWERAVCRNACFPIPSSGGRCRGRCRAKSCGRSNIPENGAAAAAFRIFRARRTSVIHVFPRSRILFWISRGWPPLRGHGNDG